MNRKHTPLPPPGRVFFTWELTYRCNYRCSYCNYSGRKKVFEPTATVYPGVEKWLEIWKDIYSRYGSCHIHLVGGEPFCYPEFQTLIEGLSRLHTWECSTNFFWGPERLIDRIDPTRARIGVSFHPEFSGLDAFLEKAVKLKKAGFEVWANIVAYPPFLSGVRDVKDRFEGEGIRSSILPFNGRFRRRKYPEAYNGAQRELLRAIGTNPWEKKTVEFAFDREKKKKNNKICRMGQLYAKIFADGDAAACCSPGAVRLGNLVRGDFALLSGPVSCASDECRCWKAMIAGETGWEKHWVTPVQVRAK